MPTWVDKKRIGRENDRRAKLSDEQVEQIRMLYADGMTQKAIAEEFDISQSNVSYLVSDISRENLKKYKQKHPSKRRTTAEQRGYMRDLRNRKRELFKRKDGE